jgi:hypothetical protein
MSGVYPIHDCQVAEEGAPIATQQALRLSAHGSMASHLDFSLAGAGRKIPWLCYHNLGILLVSYSYTSRIIRGPTSPSL